MRVNRNHAIPSQAIKHMFTIVNNNWYPMTTGNLNIRMHATLIILKQLKYQALLMNISAVNDCAAFDYKRNTLVDSHNYCHLITSYIVRYIILYRWML